ncbi:cyclodeaminase/cyclohydrolase family protein [Dictyobacter aurantiacus]|uniref:Sugar ABC transporter substrate-binding protein n=1 Tax=Dictyobacter aurantiacus TaxID=1936993 RepID=A0A401Z7Q8_9CHLR|nr:cyclodeaminase/cyclohydrolase family protein [Dictyobacter aurantiacus]GCE02869.1 sugar ABC transporter substrate-binding protein [Dictyobacter aurantiacus]
MYLDKPLQEYLDDLASSKSTPGGGSTAALSGAMGSALACMVSRLTLSKADYADVHPEIETILTQTERLRTRFQELMQADIDAYGKLSAHFKLPRGTAEEKTARTQAIQSGLVEAALVPLEMVERASELVQHCQRIAEIGNKNVLSDIATAAMMASGAGTGAAWMVRANLNSMKDAERISALNSRLNAALDTIQAGSQRVVAIVGERA